MIAENPTNSQHPMNDDHITSDTWVKRTQELLDSWERWMHEPLIERCSPVKDALRVSNADFVLVSHGTEADPLLNFANRAALRLWQMSVEQFSGTPSRLTAEPVHRAERAELLARTTRDGFISDYSGIRIASTGQRFEIHRATVWNIVDGEVNPAGQAAMFRDWTMLEVGS